MKGQLLVTGLFQVGSRARRCAVWSGVSRVREAPPLFSASKPLKTGDRGRHGEARFSVQGHSSKGHNRSTGFTGSEKRELHLMAAPGPSSEKLREEIVFGLGSGGRASCFPCGKSGWRNCGRGANAALVGGTNVAPGDGRTGDIRGMWWVSRVLVQTPGEARFWSPV